ncbi:MAG: hypothetical protein ETSY1_05210 [Candidatus Entotheonella factor]|uniref:Uncharacterized protein n=1 Tax=Entotheonella factor TaxID=1429438 RepID=W4LV58_ENTF1|nr:hypothetical protein [Candidatus Entotheonella palauensis]ETX01979.1 MAG: hypothetical protein ETSY1_05210 [Candidatus Entotheonella factor]
MSQNPHRDQSVHIGGHASGNVIVTGDHNAVSAHHLNTALPAPADVDIQAAVTALRDALAALESPESKKIANAMSDAEDELTKAQPNKDEVGQAVQRALRYAKSAEGFAKAVNTLKPHVTQVAGWLGQAWHSLASFVGGEP